MNKSSLTTKHLGIILSVFGVVIAILIITIVVVNVSLSNKNIGCTDMEGDESISCLADKYEKIDYLEATDEFNILIERAFSNEDYNFANDVIANYANGLVVDQHCEDALIFLEDGGWDERMPMINRVDFYSNAVDVAEECEDDEARTLYYQRYLSTSSSDEVQEYEGEYYIEDGDLIDADEMEDVASDE